MRRLNFEQKAPPSRDVGGLPSWSLLLVATVVVAFFGFLLA
jgi:hypothetical protein